MDTEHQRCRNCQAILHGEYCSDCGQREGSPDIQFSEAAGELLGDIFTPDSRLWRTLIALVLRPGYLPAEFMAGRKARYVAPLRLYLIISFVLFLVLSLGTQFRVLVDSGQATPSVQETQDPNAEPASVRGDELEQAAITVDISDENTPRWLRDFEQRLQDNASALGDDPEALIGLMMEYLPQMMFLLLPVFALLLKICYLFSPFHYLQHLVFSFYYHSFAYLAYLVGVLGERFGMHFDGVLFMAFIVYLPLALRRAYGSGIGGVLWKALVILSSYGVMLLAGFAIVSVMALALM